MEAKKILWDNNTLQVKKLFARQMSYRAEIKSKQEAAPSLSNKILSQSTI